MEGGGGEEKHLPQSQIQAGCGAHEHRHLIHGVVQSPEANHGREAAEDRSGEPVTFTFTHGSLRYL